MSRLECSVDGMLLVPYANADSGHSDPTLAQAPSCRHRSDRPTRALRPAEGQVRPLPGKGRGRMRASLTGASRAFWLRCPRPCLLGEGRSSTYNVAACVAGQGPRRARPRPSRSDTLERCVLSRLRRPDHPGIRLRRGRPRPWQLPTRPLPASTGRSRTPYSDFPACRSCRTRQRRRHRAARERRRQQAAVLRIRWSIVATAAKKR